MKTTKLPLRELSIAALCNGDPATYEVPIYQRNYAWEKDEIAALIQDVCDAFRAGRPAYFIGTLVSFHRGDQVYEIIDGQQRLTTVNLILGVLGIPIRNRLTYRARKKSNDTLQSLPDFDIDERDEGIVSGYRFARAAIEELVDSSQRESFKAYFQHNVRLIHYQVPKDIDLNHYFEIMNSRGEQLEQHEIVKARLMEQLEDDGDKGKFNHIWECCSEMNVYIQQKYASGRKNRSRAEQIFGKELDNFGYLLNFDELPDMEEHTGTRTIRELMEGKGGEAQPEEERIDTFQPIIDFPNFLLIVLKLTRLEMEGDAFDPESLSLDDKELLREFDKVRLTEEFAKTFGFYLLMAKFLLDNYIVHHANEEDTMENNPWKLQYWQQRKGKKGYLKNLDGESGEQQKMAQLLSMFEVSFTARQRKNYLFYCLLYLLHDEDWDIGRYCNFLAGLADKFFRDVYLVADRLNENNTPKPGSFDAAVLRGNVPDITPENEDIDFVGIYGDGTGDFGKIPLFVFNYLDYKLWERYADALRGGRTKEGSRERKRFFEALGCSDFGLKVFEQFYFSRTRRSLEHFYPQANVGGDEGGPDAAQVNCFGNYAMIGSQANSAGSNWSPRTKLDHYLDTSGKIRQVSVASLKFMVMMQRCKDNHGVREAGQEWVYEDMQDHQERMLRVLVGE